ncbi:hypothetical protein D3C86_1125680 [compost metagenome]
MIAVKSGPSAATQAVPFLTCDSSGAAGIEPPSSWPARMNAAALKPWAFAAIRVTVAPVRSANSILAAKPCLPSVTDAMSAFSMVCPLAAMTSRSFVTVTSVSFTLSLLLSKVPSPSNRTVSCGRSWNFIDLFSVCRFLNLYWTRSLPDVDSSSMDLSSMAEQTSIHAEVVSQTANQGGSPGWLW